MSNSESVRVFRTAVGQELVLGRVEGRPSAAIARILWMARARSAEDVVRPRVRGRQWLCGALLDAGLCCSVCGCRPPDPLFPQATGDINQGMTALLFAAKAGSLELCQLLVTKNADVNAKACRWVG